MQIRQGDVLLEKIEKMPENLTEKNNVLAYGEMTGHSHRFESNGAKVFQAKNGQQYCQLENPCELVHEEHKIVTIPAGVWRVINAREYDVVDGIRQVMD